MRKMRHAALTLLLILFGVSTADQIMAAQRTNEPLVIRGDNTVIVDGSTYAGRWLQYYLIRAVSQHPEAEHYAPSSQADRSQSPVFPLMTTRHLASIPEGKNIIAVGRTPYLSVEDRAALDKVPGSILIRRQGNIIVIAGDEQQPWGSPFAAISRFLDQFAGVRLYAPDELWLSTADDTYLQVGESDLLIRPAFLKTAWSHAGYERNREWQRMNASVSQNNPLRASHTLNHYFNPDKYYDQYPEIYEMRNSVRPRPQGQIWNPCLSAPMLPEIAMAEVRERMAGDRKPSYLSFGVMDIHMHCECEICQASVQKHQGSYSNLYYAFMNKLATMVAAEYPDLYLTTYAYANVRRPPVEMTIEPNIVVDYVSKTYNWVNPQWAQAEQKAILGWAATGAKWIAHDWSFGGVSPREYTRQFADFLQWGKQNGMMGIYIEWSPGEQWYLDGARYWIKRRLLSDPYQDVSALWKQYCDDMYGPASEQIYRLFSHFADKYTYSDNYISRDDLPRREMALYDEADLSYQRALLDEAQKLASGDALVLQRLATLERYWKGHYLFALAVGEPARLQHRFRGKSINPDLLQFYLMDDGSRLREAVDYYRFDRTVSPDDHPLARALGLFESYLANYSRGLGDILSYIRVRALDHVNITNPDPQSAAVYLEAADVILQQYLPEDAPASGVQRIEQMLDKVVVVPVAENMPVLDGRVDDLAWEKAVLLDAFTIRDLLIASEHETEARIMRIGDKLVIAVTAQQAGPIWARTAPEIETGSWLWRESGVEFFFGPAPSADDPNPPYAQFIVNAYGAFEGFGVARGQRADVQVATRLDEDAGIFVIEAAFPLKGDRYDLSSETALSFNLMRNVYTADTYTSDQIIGWAPIILTAQAPESRGLLFLPR